MAQERTVQRDVPQTTRETVAETTETVTSAAPPPGPTDITVVPGGRVLEHAAGDGSANTLDEEVARAKERFDAAQRRWWPRGREDGRRWAITTATREELRDAATASYRQTMSPISSAGFTWPSSFDHQAAIDRRIWADAGLTPGEVVESPERNSGYKDIPEKREALEAARKQCDSLAYIEGWLYGATQVWDGVKSAFV